jgi:Domain of unknown function (DUF4263)
MRNSSEVSIDTLQRKFLKLINGADVSEEDVHQFLVNYPVFVPALWPYENTIFSKLSLANQHTVDFAHARTNTPGATWHLIEIERPQEALFTKAGNPTAKLSHAMRQLQDWYSWFIEERDFVFRRFPHQSFMRKAGLWKPELWLVMGRRASVADSDRRLLQRLNEGHVIIKTFDWLLDHAAWPACDRSAPLRCCNFVNGRIAVISQMKMNVSFSLSSKRV